MSLAIPPDCRTQTGVHLAIEYSSNWHRFDENAAALIAGIGEDTHRSQKGNDVRLSLRLIQLCVLCISLSFGAKGHAAIQSAPPTLGPQPSAAMRSLTKAIAGKWSTIYKFEPSEMMPHGGNGAGEEEWRSGPGGFTLVEEEQIHVGKQEMYILALHWWDKAAESFRGILCNNSGPQTCDVDSYQNTTLMWDEKQFVIDMKFMQKGEQMVWHEVWSDITATSFTQTGDMGRAGGPLKRVVTIHGSKTTDGIH